MFRQKRRRVFFIKNKLLKNYFLVMQREITDLLFDIVQAANYLMQFLFTILNFLYQKTKAAITLFCNWAIQYRLVQFIVNQIKESAFAIQQFCSFASVQFKTFVVNYMPIRAFVLIARVLPIGGWLIYEEQDSLVGHTSFSYAVRDKDFILLDRILKVCSQEALYRYLFMKNYIGIGPLQYAFFHHGKDITASEKILKAIFPGKRLWILNNLTTDFYPSPLVVFSLVQGDDRAPHCQKVLELLPEKDKSCFINQVDKDGDSPIILQAFNGDSWELIKAFLNHYPKEHLVDYLNIQNEDKETFLMAAVQHSWNNYTDKIIELVPENQRAAYLAKYNQGLKTLLYAKSSSPSYYINGHVAALEKYGIKIPEKYANLFGNALKKQLPKIFEELDAQEEMNGVEQPVKFSPNENTVRENFKLKHGIYPLEVLQVQNEEANLSDIKKAYKKLVLFSHPDKNKNSEEVASARTTLINEAYGVYAKSDVRKSYYHIKL